MKTSPTTSRTFRRIGAATLALGLFVGLSACGDDKKSDDKPSTTPAAGGSAVAATTPTIFSAWARTSPANVKRGAAYMRIENTTADKLLTAAVDSSVAGKAEIHEVVPDTSMSSMPPTSDDHSDHGSMPGMGSTPANMPMKMQEVEFIEIPANHVVELKPGGYHVMLLDLAKPLEKGQSFELTLTFEKAGDVKVTVPVQDDAP